MLLGTHLLSKGALKYLEAVDDTMKSDTSSRPSTPSLEEFDNNNDETEKKITTLRNIVGDDISIDRIKHVLHGADGSVEIALNHLLNDIEKDREKEKEKTSKYCFTFQ